MVGYLLVLGGCDIDWDESIMIEPIKTVVTIAKIQTMADGGLRFVFDAGEMETLQAAYLMECKRFGVAGELTFIPIENTPPHNKVTDNE